MPLKMKFWKATIFFFFENGEYRVSTKQKNGHPKSSCMKTGSWSSKFIDTHNDSSLHFGGIAAINNYSTWFAAIALKPFSFKVKNLRFAPKVTSSLKVRLKLGVILHNLGNEWIIVYFVISKKEKHRIWINLL